MSNRPITVTALPPRAAAMAMRPRLPAGAEVAGWVTRGPDRGWLVRLASGSLVLMTPAGSIQTLPQAAVLAQLARVEAQ